MKYALLVLNLIYFFYFLFCFVWILHWWLLLKSWLLCVNIFNFFLNRKKTNTTKYYCINICSRWWCPNVCITLWKKHDVSQQRCVYLCDWVYVYIHVDIYIDADDDDDDILGHFLFWSAVFLFCFLKGNNTFDGKIIVTWLKIARLCGYLAYQGHNIYDVRSRLPDLVYMSEMIFFL